MRHNPAAALFLRAFVPDGALSRLILRHVRLVQGLCFWGTLALYPLFCGLSWLRILVRKALRLKPAVVWGPTPILTIAESSALLRSLGYPSTTVVYTVYYIRQDFDVNLTNVIRHPAVGWWLPNAVFLWSLLKFDVFHFFYDGGLWSGLRIVPWAKWLELPLLRLAGKRVIASAYGADVRIKALAERWQPLNLCGECPEPGKYCICDSAAGLTNARYYRDWSNALLAMGDMHDYVFGSRRDFNYWPIDLAKIPFVGCEPHPGPVRVVHSPNHRYFKGTHHLEKAVAALRGKGLAVELVMVEGVSNVEAKRRYAEADVVFAQCLAGWIGYTEIEAMAAGKPVISYLRGRGELDHAPGCPVLSATPETLTAQLERLVNDPPLRSELGRRGREWVERHWSYEGLRAHYDALHREVWEHNGLGATLGSKWRDFFQGERRWRVGGPLEGPVLREWPVHADPFLEMRRFESGLWGQPPFDESGLPRVFARGRYVEHPGAIAWFALQAFHCGLSEPADATHRDRFLRAARWLEDRLVRDETGVGRWLHQFGGPCLSAETQGLGISTLLRADQLAPGGGFLDAAVAAVSALRVPVVQSGFLRATERGPEIAEPGDAADGPLAGRIAALFALQEAHRVTGQDWMGELFESCAGSLAAAVENGEGGPEPAQTSALGDVPPFLDGGDVVARQLRALHGMTGDARFERSSRAWSRRLRGDRLRRFVAFEAPI